jgi:hypothetical protein
MSDGEERRAAMTMRQQAWFWAGAVLVAFLVLYALADILLPY